MDAGVHSHVSATGPSPTSPATPQISSSPRRVSLDHNPNSRKKNDNSTNKSSIFDFDNNADTADVQQVKQQHRPLTPYLETPLRNAKAYFQELDSNHPLQITTNEESSAKKEQVWRTSYKINMKSPGLQQEYSQYVSNLQGLGVTKPLSLQDYVEGRRDFFRKGELYNGFLDD